jgi:hypothetical protein
MGRRSRDLKGKEEHDDVLRVPGSIFWVRELTICS